MWWATALAAIHKSTLRTCAGGLAGVSGAAGGVDGSGSKNRNITRLL